MYSFMFVDSMMTSAVGVGVYIRTYWIFFTSQPCIVGFSADQITHD